MQSSFKYFSKIILDFANSTYCVDISLGDTLIELTPNEKEIYVLVAGTVRLSANLSDGPKILEGREILGRSGVFL